MPNLLFSCLRKKAVSWFRHDLKRFAAAVCGLGLVGSGLVWAKGPEKPVTIALADLGQQAAGGRPQVPGSTQATVHFVGDHHLLVTFPVRRLMKRLEDSEPEDEDHTIEAVLVDVPSGKVAARTSWRVHDSGQYLWDLGHGRFLVRVRDRLVTVAPLANLSTEHPFEERPLLTYERRVVGVLVSAEADLLTVETVARHPAVKGVQQVAGPVELSFYRIEGEKGAAGAASAGRVVSRVPVELPMTRDGYLDTSEEKRGRWVFDYISHGGKKTELSPYDTTCYPVAKFVSRSEFVAFGCRGSSDKLEIGGFDMRGEEMWQQNLTEAFVHPTFSFAPEAGRFALGRALTVATTGMMAGIDPDGQQLLGQDVEVLQAHSGKQIFHTVVTPAQRSGQNFALAPDGMEVAVIRGTTIEVYRLPGLSGKDVQEVKAAREIALERANGPIVLPTRSRVVLAAAEEPEDVGGGARGVAPVKQTEPVAVVKPVEHTVQVGDGVDDGPRKAPTLYKPGETGAPQ